MPEALRKQAPEENPRSLSLPSYHDTGLIFEPGEIYAHLIGALRDLLNCTGAALLLPTDSTAAVPAQFGPHPLPAQINLSTVSTQILAHMARTQQPMALSRPAPFQLPLPAPARAEAWMGIPFLLEGRLHACLSAVEIGRASCR